MELLADRYELGDALGHGRSTVYRATDSRLRRQVAIKRVELLAGQEDAESVRARALREAQASARLNNPSTVAVYDVVEESGAIWLVMELVDGPSLAQLVADEGALPHDRAARLGLQVLTALEAAHLAGVVHRDVKPANVLVLPGDRAKLTDFGVATIRDESRVTLTGLIVGSPSYMAPEQATGGDITPATDLWALGALLYFAVEGEPPFLAGTALATASAVVHGEPRAPEHPGPLAPIIARLLTKDPAGRPTAGAVRATLTRVSAPRRSSSATAVAPVPPVVAAPRSSPCRRPRSPRPRRSFRPPRSPHRPRSRRPLRPRRRPRSAPPTEVAPPAAAASPTDGAPTIDTAARGGAVSTPLPARTPPAPESTAVHHGDPGVAAVPPIDPATRRRTGPAPRIPVGAVAAIAVVVLVVAALALQRRRWGRRGRVGR